MCVTAPSLLRPERRRRFESVADLTRRSGRRPEFLVVGGTDPGATALVHRYRQSGTAVHVDPATALDGVDSVVCVGHDAAEVVLPVIRQRAPGVAVVVDVGSLDAIALGRDLAATSDEALRDRPFNSRFSVQLSRELNACAAADAVIASDPLAADLLAALLAPRIPIEVLHDGGGCSGSHENGATCQAAARLDGVLAAAAGNRVTAVGGRQARGPKPVTGPSKIFCIGLNKTGTTSLHLALEAMGLQSLHWAGEAAYLDVLRAKREGRRLLHYVGEGWDAYSDIETLSRHFEVADQHYPGSSFILTVRNREAWLDSRRRHVERNRRNKANGTYAGRYLRVEPEAWRIEWDEHLRRVTDYFACRPGDLLVVDVCGIEGYGRLAPFLGLPIPAGGFPVANVDLARR